MGRYDLNIKKKIVPLLIILLAAALLLYAIFVFFAGPKISPNKLLTEAIQNTVSSKTFHYRMEVKTSRQSFLSVIEGERISPDRIHIKGNMFNTPVEFIQIGSQAYMKDIWTDKWIALKSNSLGQTSMFIEELGPVNFLNYGSLLDVHYAGTEKINGKKMSVIEFNPQLVGPFSGQKYQGYHCKTWVDQKERLIGQVVLNAGLKKSDLPTVTLNFWGFGQPVSINPPSADYLLNPS
ncbi:MAG: hypothetical protein XD78_1302 [Desulfotomaculum sp. 46_296]|nr:MAG: hypothetical protein XD78_1302 [Desulfotomaculum sp. 46_296]HAU32456.1 hypothetical protein [Desulfotomaculum sp.]